MRIIYHDDIDGRAAAAIARLAGPAWAGADLLPLDYGSGWRLDPVAPAEPVLVVDCMVEPAAAMAALASTAALTWIDHHASSLRAETQSPVLRRAAGVRREELAACELAWHYFHPHEPAPRAVSLLGRYDRWDVADPSAWHGEIMPLQVAVESYPTDPGPDLDFWRRLLAGEAVEALIEAGTHIWRYQRQRSRQTAARQAREVRLDGLRVIALNAAGDSQLFETVWDPRRHDAMVLYRQMADGTWSVSLYTPKPEVDVSVLAEARGGGGHRGAAGFGVKEIGGLFQPS
ncbi:MAG: hypothetical protein ABIL09_00390 [Gemmatimonadota bacterium]